MKLRHSTKLRSMLSTQRRYIPPFCTSTASPKKAKVAVFGSGRMGTIRSQLVYANPMMELVGIVDTASTNNDNQTGSLASSLGTEAYSSLSDLVANNTLNPLDGIVCSTPTHTHASVVQDALALETTKGIFVEKPVDESASKIKAIFEHVQNDVGRNFHLCCGFQRRFDPSYQNLLETVRSGAIGKPLNANIFFGDHPVPSLEFLKEGGDIFMDLSAHDVDFVLQVMGQRPEIGSTSDSVESIFASGTSSIPDLADIGVHDNATLTMKFQSGSVATIFMSRSASYGYDQRCEIFGTEGLCQIANRHENSVMLSNKDGIHQSKYLHSFPQRFEKAFGIEMDFFAAVLLGKQTWPITVDDCIRVQVIADAAQESCRTGQLVHL